MDQRFFLLPPLVDQVVIDHTRDLSWNSARHRYQAAELEHQRWLLQAAGTADGPASLGQRSQQAAPGGQATRPQRRFPVLLAWVQAGLRLVHGA
jgi:hypothetical protein